MNKIVDLFGHNVESRPKPDWASIIKEQTCPFIEKRCYKVRKSQPEISIGTCTVEYGGSPVIICPLRLLDKRQIFTDCLHLLTGHEPGNQLHIVSEISVPGGSIDYILVSAREGRVRDFVGIELQTLDTTGAVWPERQRFLAEQNIQGINASDTSNKKIYGMNWKMTAKTILVQLHHKIHTFENVNKHLVLVIQDRLLDYMRKEFSFSHLNNARTSDPMHFHPYELTSEKGNGRLNLMDRLSTDTAGIAACLGLQTEAKIDLEVISNLIEQKLSTRTLFSIGSAIPPTAVDPSG